MEEEKLLQLQKDVIEERQDFVRFIFNGSWNSVVHRENIDIKLLDYEQTVAVAATSGIEMATKDVIYKWSYIQAVFFTSTILTTIGKYLCNNFYILDLLSHSIRKCIPYARKISPPSIKEVSRNPT